MDSQYNNEKNKAVNLRECEEGIHGMGRTEGKEGEKLCNSTLKLNICI